MAEPQVFLTVAEVAQQLRVSESTVTRAIREEKLRASRVGRAWRISPTDLAAYLDAGANRPEGT